MIKNNKGQAGGIIGLVIGIILIVGVSIPVTTSVISTSNLTGLTATIVGFIPVMLGVGGLVLASSMAK